MTFAAYLHDMPIQNACIFIARFVQSTTFRHERLDMGAGRLGART